jgi:predicted alpha-1,2-mannosidase
LLFRRNQKVTRSAAAVVAAIGMVTLGTTAASAAGETARPSLVKDPASLVNTFIGTSNGGDEFPGAAAPFGMIDWSPDTSSRTISGGYDYGSGSTIGLSVSHLSGAGCPIEEDLPILPTVGAIGSNPVSTTDSFSHSAESATPGSYSVQLGTGGQTVGTEIATTTRTGIGQFTFPKTTSANVLFKAGDSQSNNTNATVNITGGNEVTGSVSAGGFCDMQNKYTLYYVAEFSKPFSSYGTWNGSNVTAGSGTASGTSSGGWATFDTSDGQPVLMKVALSYVSTADAMANLNAENQGWSVADVASQTHQAWNHLLSEVQVGGGTHDQQVQFYTALYHGLLDPTTFSDDNGDYIGFDGKAHNAGPGGTQYTSFSGWDIYRSEVPLLAMLAPAQTSQMMQSLVNDAEQGGWLPKWPVANGYTGMMDGDSADAILAEAYAFGARNFDVKAALAAMIKGATQTPSASQLGQGYYEERPQGDQYNTLGYVPNTEITSGSATTVGGSETLEYATDDFAISQLASALGQRQASQEFLARSQNWTSLFNVDSGFIQPRDANGNFPAGDPNTTGLGSVGQSGFQEGTAGQYTWMVPQDLNGLITAVGGKAQADARLDQFFTQLNAGPNSPDFYVGDETDMSAPWTYDYAGEPYKAQKVVHDVLDTQYSDTTGGEPGNDDLGAMSAYYVWASLGMYPVTPGTSVLALSSPVFPAVRLNLPHHHVTISSPTASDANYYIQGVRVNGQAWGNDWLNATDLTGTGDASSSISQISFDLGATPDQGWASGARQEPPSYQAGPLHFPQGQVPATVTSSPATTTVTAGSSATATLTFDIGVGSAVPNPTPVKTITWTATPPAGITVSPSSGTLQVGADGTASTSVTFSAASDVTQGFNSVNFGLTSTPDEPLPALSVPLAIVGTGDTATVCTTLGTTNVDDGITQMEGGDGTTAPVTEDGESGRTTVQEVPNDLNMYFQVDPRIADNGDFSATVTLEYYDAGTNGWQLQYDKHGGSAYTSVLSVTNTNTNTWKTVTATLPDAAMAKAMNNSADFRIASGGPVIIHSANATITGTGVLPMDLCPSAS